MKLFKKESRIITSLKSNLFLQNVALITGGNAIAKLLGVISVPVITRLYLPEDYGIFTLFASIIGVLGSLSTLRYEVTVPLAKDDNEALNLIRLSLLITILWSALISGILLIFSNYLINRFKLPDFQQYLWVIPVALLGGGIYRTFTNYAVRENYFKLITRSKLIQGILAPGIKIGLGLLGIVPLGLFIGMIASQVGGVNSFLVRIVKKKPSLFKHFRKKEIVAAAKRYKHFPVFQSWSQLLLSLGVQLPVFFIGIYYGAETIGVYGLAQNIINMPMNLLGQSVSQVYYAEIAKFGKQRKNAIYKLSVSLIKKLFYISFLPIITILLFGPWIFRHVFGPEWNDAGVYARLLAPSILARFISAPIINCLNVLEKQKIQLGLNLVRILLIATLFVISHKLNFNSKEVVLSYSLFIFLFYTFVSVYILSILKKE